MAFLEYRHMMGNLKPHEAVRRLHEMFDTFKPSGDPAWPMRTLRDVMNDLNRTYSLRYHAMSELERITVVKLVLYEACRRYVQAHENNQETIAKYDLIVNLCRAYEQQEQGICTMWRYFERPRGEDEGSETCWLSSQNVKKGYEHSFPYKNVQEYASVDAQSEIATVLHENEEKVTEVLQRMRNEWLNLQLQIVNTASETVMEP